MRTSIYINSILLDKLKSTSEALKVSKNELISLLISRIITNKYFEPKPYKSVKYQHGCSDIVWKRAHIRFEPEFYEKALTLRRNFKFSVSWFIAFAIVNYLDEIVKELTGPERSENNLANYHRDFVYIVEKLHGVHVFITLLGISEEKT